MATQDDDRAASPDRLDSAGLTRWGLVAAALSLGGLVFAAGAADDYMYVSGLLFVGFGLLLALRLFGRWTP
ncbi:MAG: hypothetical protein H7Z10_10800 [Gemmatimonadaceae bacterium]|nr:hypothetical protein [Acetobacteraceae bacterium]